MWLVTTSGFLSVVRNLDSAGTSDALLVRGRARLDLERLADFAGGRGHRPAILETFDADYGYRLTTSREVLAAFMVERIDALTYPNFKNEVAKTDPARAHVYLDVWSALRSVQAQKDER